MSRRVPKLVPSRALMTALDRTTYKRMLMSPKPAKDQVKSIHSPDTRLQGCD